MRHLADWLGRLFGDVRVDFLPAGDPFAPLA